MPRYFSLSEAERVLQTLLPEMQRALSLRNDMRMAEQELQDVARKVTMTGGLMVDRERVAAVRKTREQVVERLQSILENIQDTGCLVKDLDMGLLDFPTLYRGQEVYLCWKAGEEAIRFWHGADEGFRGRKPIDDEFLRNHKGG